MIRHIVDQHDDQLVHRDTRAHRERAPHVCLAPVSGQVRLRRGSANPHERIDERQTEMPRQFPCLVESTRALARGMQGNGNDGIRTVEDINSGCTHPLGEPARNAGAPVVLQGVHDRAKRLFVWTDRSCERNVRRKTNGPEWRKRRDRAPAAAADRASGGFVERRPARGANGREQDRDEAV